MPDALPQIRLRGPLATVGDGNSLLHRRRYGAKVLLRQLVAEVEGMEDLFDRPDLTVRQILDAAEAERAIAADERDAPMGIGAL